MNAPNPEWRVIAEFPMYEVSSEGYVRTWRRKSRKWRNPQPGVRDEPVVLKGSVSPLGYVAFILRKEAGGKPYRRTAHRLVAQAFLAPPEPGQTDVCHNDGNPANNRVENLRWDTHQNNQRDMLRHGTAQCGDSCVTAKLTDAEALEIFLAVISGPRGTQKRIAKKYGVSRALVCNIAKGNIRKHQIQSALQSTQRGP